MRTPPLVIGLLVVVLVAAAVVVLTDVPGVLKALVVASALGFAGLIAVTARRHRQGR